MFRCCFQIITEILFNIHLSKSYTGNIHTFISRVTRSDANVTLISNFVVILLASFTPAVDERFMLSYQDGSAHDMEGRYSN